MKIELTPISDEELINSMRYTIENLEAERDALAAQLAELREALLHITQVADVNADRCHSCRAVEHAARAALARTEMMA